MTRARIEATCRLAGRFRLAVPGDAALSFAAELVRQLEPEDPVSVLEIVAGEDRWTWDRRRHSSP